MSDLRPRSSDDHHHVCPHCDHCSPQLCSLYQLLMTEELTLLAGNASATDRKDNVRYTQTVSSLTSLNVQMSSFFARVLQIICSVTRHMIFQVLFIDDRKRFQNNISCLFYFLFPLPPSRRGNSVSLFVEFNARFTCSISISLASTSSSSL